MSRRKIFRQIVMILLIFTGLLSAATVHAELNSLDLHGDHYRQRKIERNIPAYVLDKITNFNAAEWRPVMCEVRTDKGKFINSTWELNFDGRAYRITIGFNNLVMTVVTKKSAARENL